MSNPYAKNLRTVIFDIETMGLMPGRDMIINAGFCDPETLDVTQLFAESPMDEERLLKDIVYLLSQYEAVVTYNGDRFDIPFVKTRLKKYSDETFPLFWSVDMYRYLKKYWPVAQRMQHLNQKSVEYALGLSDKREDEIGGGECIPLYNSYLINNDVHSKELILLHNSDDVKQLAKIYNMTSFLPYDRIAFEAGFGIAAKDFVLCRSLRLDKSYLYAEAVKNPGGIPTSIFEDNFELEYDCFTGKIRLKILLKQNGNLKYVDLTALPCNKNELKDLEGYHSDFLVLYDSGEIRYQEINYLIGSILSSEGLF